MADYLRVRETPTGFPIVEAVGPLALAEGFGETEGPVLGIADTHPDPDESPSDDVIYLSPDGCNAGSGVSGTYGSLCLAEGNVFASIYGDRDFVRAVVDGLRVEDFRTGVT